MDHEVWEKCPTTTNAVERRNLDCPVPNPLHPKLAMMEAYKLDKVACYKFIAAEEGTSISYRSKTDEARKHSAAARRSERKRKTTADKENEFGPPDKRCHFSEKQMKRNPTVTSVTVDESVINVHSNLHPEVIGKRVRVN